MSRTLRVVLALVVGLLVAAAGTSPAAAHAQLIESDPADGSVVATAPEEVTLTFNEPVRLERARLFAADGTELDVDARSSDSVVTVVPSEELGEGTIVVSWELESADGHVVSGAISFSVGAPTAGTTNAAASAEAGPAAIAAGVLGALGALVALAGVLLARPLLQRAGWAAALVGGVLWLPLQTGDGLLASAAWLDGALSWRGLLLVGALAGLAGVVQAGRQARAGVGAVVLVAAAVGLVVVPPPATEVPAAAAPPSRQELAGELGDGQVIAVVDRADDGAATLEIGAVDADGEAVEPVAEPAVRLLSEDLDLGPIPLEETGVGTWTGTVRLPVSGEWTLEVSVRVTDFDNPVASIPFSWSG